MAIFHEGSKYWACCKKGCLEFEEMLQQPGCTTGKVGCKMMVVLCPSYFFDG